MTSRTSSSVRPKSDESATNREGVSNLRQAGGTELAIPINMEAELAREVDRSGRKPVLMLLKGEGEGHLFALADGANLIGRADSRPVQIDLEPFETTDRIWSSRQHAVIHRDSDRIVLEDLNSLNGTFVNKTRVHPRQPRPLLVDDVIQIGTVQLKLIYI